MFLKRVLRISSYILAKKRLFEREIIKRYSTTKLNSLFSKQKLTGFLFTSIALSLNEKSFKLEADSLYDEGQFDKLYLLLKDHNESSDPEILWRLARAIFENCRILKDDKEKLLLYEKALQIVDKALEIEEKCWAAHKWRAILLDYVWRYKSTKERIVHSFDIRKHMDRAVELNPSDPTSYYLIGEWCFTFADMPWYQRKVASAIFASPPTSTYDEALSYFEKAENISPLFYSKNLLMIGKCYLRMDNKEQAAIYLNLAKNYSIKTVDDQEAHDEAEKLLKDLKI